VNKRRSRPTGAVAAELRTWCEREFFLARAVMRARPLQTVPPGDDPKDWRLYLSVHARPLLEACVRTGIWEPEESAPPGA
jgi:hypothetical protein